MGKFWKIFITLTMMICLCACSSQKDEESNDEIDEVVETNEEEIEEGVSTSITLTFVGDITLGNYVGQGYDGSFNQKYQSVNASYFLENVQDVFATGNLTIANLEGPLTDASDYQIKTFAFSGLPEYREILKEGNIDVVTLANNHSQDYYDEGMADTKENLEAVDINYFGYETTCIEEVNGIKIGFIGLSFPQEYGDLTKSLIAQLEDETDLIVIYVHWGIERDEAPQATQIELAHTWIDNGVDLVIGSHPHVVQGIETYNGKTIVYSLGNFYFGGNKNPTDKDSMIYQHTFTFTNGEVTDEESNVTACSISSSSSSNNYQPTVLTGSEKTRVETKIEERSELIKNMVN
ncbi:MAG: CapA family protein [Erysipelotrichaceae bacterium]|nr:CapA family protein [Erysipelotrichaceae bacterium]